MLQSFVEGKAQLSVYKQTVVSKDLPVFYNPMMKTNRDISLLLLKALKKKNMQVADPLAGSGVRSIRFLLELPKSTMKLLCINDGNPDAVKLIKKNIKRNQVSTDKVEFFAQDANQFLFDHPGFDYIDIDPFGSPNPFLDLAVKRISRDGILAVTATDTAPLCGTYPKTCERKYWATPQKGPQMHEIGLRILIRKVQLLGVQYNKALTPIYSYSKDHYFRIFFHCEKGKKQSDDILSKHDMLDEAGPLWIGQLWDKTLAKKMLEEAQKNTLYKKDSPLLSFLTTIQKESLLNTLGLFDLHDLSRREKIKELPKKEEAITLLKKKGYKASPTHFRGEAIKTTASEKEVLKILKKK